MTREGYHWQSHVWRPSDTQGQILDGVAKGMTNAEIAATMGMTLDGVKWHVSRALAETGLHDRQSLARWWQGGPLRMSVGGPYAEPVSLDYTTSMRAMSRSFGAGHNPVPAWRILDRSALSDGYADQPTSWLAE